MLRHWLVTPHGAALLMLFPDIMYEGQKHPSTDQKKHIKKGPDLILHVQQYLQSGCYCS